MFRHKRLMLIFFGLLCLFLVFYGVTRITEQYRLDKMVGQMIMVGFRGTDSTDPAIQELASDIASGRVGGVIIYSVDLKMASDAGVSDALARQLTKTRNIVSVPQLAKLNRFLADTARANDNPALLIAIEQAGGVDTQLKPEHGFGYIVPAPRLMADALTTDQAKQVYRGLGERLYDIGINLNLGPDITFSDDENIDVQYVGAFTNGMTETGMLYGLSAPTDSSDLYHRLVNSQMPGIVMMSETINQNLDAEYPATLSKRTVTELLRNQLDYNGVVISADLTDPIMGNVDLSEKLRLAILAGNDILLLGNNVTYTQNVGRVAHDTIVNMVKQGQIPRSKIHNSYRRIMKLKSNLKH